MTSGKGAYMQANRDARRAAYIAKAQLEISSLEERGFLLAGNAFSSLLVVKGHYNAAEVAGAELLSGEDGTALRSALARLGYPPQDFAAIGTVLAGGAQALPAEMRRAVLVLDPATVVAADEESRLLLREAFAEEFAGTEKLDEAMFSPGVLCTVAGMRFLALGGFEESLADNAAKQLMWARLKQIPPLGEPF